MAGGRPSLDRDTAAALHAAAATAEAPALPPAHPDSAVEAELTWSDLCDLLILGQIYE